MIIKCKVCRGTGHILLDPLSFLGGQSVCPACKGAGEFEIIIPIEKQIVCKFCNGKGVVQGSPLEFLGSKDVCPACKGIGVIERPVVGTGQKETNSVAIPQTPRLSHYDFDIAISFASEDRECVKNYSDGLSSQGLKVFYDKYEQVGLWGANLYDKFDEVYRTKALFCVIFVSQYYAKKVWTNHERRSAQARALQENREYVLPIRLDDTEIQGILPTVGYLDLREIPVEELIRITIEKVNQLKNKNK